MLVKYGPLMARGVDYYESGIQAAGMTQQLLVNNRKPYELGIVRTENKEVFVNMNTLTALGLNIPESLKKNVVAVR